ncbi:8-oxo-dGTP pyrophosphatase MutT (NUDIX family) [Kitasatospora atroaurantiaca]|uniref:8-oxo-dGTP pyrophosphatase MutT (NUDIX family) n=1 Tax=Kitasatospora atroaurantiaca TaxID=285545 RepID=A0A561F1Q7_9ACTN|nr:NUDIX hydrolase [Kitasatospora atroaurantiaca]TWE21796.1 8-oxo-dGTP pyrophosphatase MutT (NUDIX family) [Kitasatospora atroaurantiaca]
MADQTRQGWLPPEQFVPTLPHGIAYAAFVFRDSDDRVLALHSAYDRATLNLPGGLLDPDEDLLGCARRETIEELGFLPASVDQHTPQLLVLSFTAPQPPWPWKVGAFFDGGILTDQEISGITLDPAEHTAFAFKSVKEWAAIADERRAQVLHAATSARRTGRTAYLGPTDQGTQLRAAGRP